MVYEDSLILVLKNKLQKFWLVVLILNINRTKNLVLGPLLQKLNFNSSLDFNFENQT